MERTPCENCGLKAVRYELERQGIFLRFCDTCYWGDQDVEIGPPGSALGEEGPRRLFQGGRGGHFRAPPLMYFGRVRA